MWGKRKREHPGGTRHAGEVPDKLLADPTMALMVGMEAMKQAGDYPVKLAQAQMYTAEALRKLGRQAGDGDSRKQASVLGRVPWIFEAGSCRPVRCLTD